MDKKILKLVVTGDKEAFRLLYDEVAGKALGVAIGITRDKGLAKDAVQETFIKVYRYMERFDANRAFEPWFYQILVNECNRIMKRESRLKLVSDDGRDTGDSEARNAAEIIEDVNEALQSLDEDCRVPMVLKYIKGFSEKEVAEALNMNQNTVKTRLFKGRERLKELFSFSEDRGA